MQNNVQQLRQQMEISQAKLGEMVGVSRQTINSLESGRYNPSIILAFRLAAVFSKKIEEIFIYEESDDE